VSPPPLRGSGDCDACPPGLRSVTKRHSFTLCYTPPPACGAIPRDDRSGDQTSVLRQTFWNDRLDVQIEICLITQAAAIVEIELKGTLTRPRPGSASSSRGQSCRALQAASGKSQPCLHSYCHLGQCDWRISDWRIGCRSRPTHVTLQALSPRSVWLAPGDERVFGAIPQTTVSTGRH
jgi:hypothetical protein